MPKTKILLTPVKEAIVRAKESGASNRAVAKLFNISHSAVSKVFSRWKNEKQVSRKPKSGRPRKTTDRTERGLVKIVKNDSKKTAVDLVKHAQDQYGLSISARTARRILKRAHLVARSPAIKPLISKKNRIARLAFARRHLLWTTSEEWSKVIWSDESKFNLFGSDGLRYVRRPTGKRWDPKYVIPTVKHGFCMGLFYSGCNWSIVSHRRSYDGFIAIFFQRKCYRLLVKN